MFFSRGCSHESGSLSESLKAPAFIPLTADTTLHLLQISVTNPSLWPIGSTGRLIPNVALFCLPLEQFVIRRRRRQTGWKPQGALIRCRSSRSYCRRLGKSDTNSWPAAALEHLWLHAPLTGCSLILPTSLPLSWIQTPMAHRGPRMWPVLWSRSVLSQIYQLSLHTASD